MTIGDRMLQYRARHNLSQTELGALIGEGISTIFRAESGKYRTHKANEIRLTEKMNKLESDENVQM